MINLERGEYKLKAVFLADHERHYNIYRGENLVGELYVYPRFRDARVELMIGEFYINENNCNEVLSKIKDEDLRSLIRDQLVKLNIYKQQ